ncbi:MAG: PAS domain-containing protein [Planctomycetia bacterium]|jgi:PAS domain S-box-containing protein
METQSSDHPATEAARLKMELHRALKTLKQADLLNERYEQIIRHLDAIVLSLDPDGKILFVNDFGLKFFGYEAEELIGQQVLGTLIPVTTEESGRYLPEMLCRLLENPGSFETNENENVTRDGKRHLVAWKNWAVQDRHGELVEIVCLGNVLKSLGSE